MISASVLRKETQVASRSGRNRTRIRCFQSWLGEEDPADHPWPDRADRRAEVVRVPRPVPDSTPYDCTRAGCWTSAIGRSAPVGWTRNLRDRLVVCLSVLRSIPAAAVVRALGQHHRPTTPSGHPCSRLAVCVPADLFGCADRARSSDRPPDEHRLSSRRSVGCRRSPQGEPGDDVGRRRNRCRRTAVGKQGEQEISTKPGEVATHQRDRESFQYPLARLTDESARVRQIFQTRPAREKLGGGHGSDATDASDGVGGIANKPGAVAAGL
jgi:hypothetical protein